MPADPPPPRQRLPFQAQSQEVSCTSAAIAPTVPRFFAGWRPPPASAGTMQVSSTSSIPRDPHPHLAARPTLQLCETNRVTVKISNISVHKCMTQLVFFL
ncbi:hypothetical protein BS78_01G148200 [Paspalum vaginatum]|nr:hypothetical protein BS78_01G148200 [Paspalum vaginatum]